MAVVDGADRIALDVRVDVPRVPDGVGGRAVQVALPLILVGVEGHPGVADRGVYGVEVGGVLAVEIVPPVTHKVFLVKDGAIGAEEGVLSTVVVTHVENLSENFKMKSLIEVCEITIYHGKSTYISLVAYSSGNTCFEG